MTDDLSALRRKLEQLQARHDAGALAADEYATQKARIERELLDRVLANPAAPRMSKRFAASLGAVVLAVAAAGYWWTGSPGLASAPGGAMQAAAPDGAAPSAAERENERKFVEVVEQLAAKLKEHPDNADGWGLLARSYVRLGRLEPALAAFKQAAALRPDDASLLADYADVLAVANGRSLQGEPDTLIERALAIEPDNLKALSLAGAAAFDRQDYARAVRHWERVVSLSPPDSPYLAELQAGIDEARRLAEMAPRGAAPAVAAAAASPRAAASGTPATTPSAAGAPAGIRGSVRLAPALAASAAPGDTVFVYARAAEGPRMPLAIVRLKVSDLPAAFTLDDSLAMSPAARLSGADRVIVSARVSKSGQATPSAGDLIGETPAMANRGDGVALVIDRVVKP